MLKKIFIFQILTGMVFSFILVNFTGCCPPAAIDKIKRANYVPIPVKFPDVKVFQVITKENTGGCTFENSGKETLDNYLEKHQPLNEKGEKEVYKILQHLKAGNTLEHFLKLEKEFKDKEDLYHIYWGIDSRIGKPINKNYDIIVLVQYNLAFALYRFKLDDKGDIVKDDNSQPVYDDTAGQKFKYNSLVVFPRKYVLELSR